MGESGKLDKGKNNMRPTLVREGGEGKPPAAEEPTERAMDRDLSDDPAAALAALGGSQVYDGKRREEERGRTAETPRHTEDSER